MGILGLSVLNCLRERGAISAGVEEGSWKVPGSHLKMGAKHCVAHEPIRCVLFNLT